MAVGLDLRVASSSTARAGPEFQWHRHSRVRSRWVSSTPQGRSQPDTRPDDEEGPRPAFPLVRGPLVHMVAGEGFEPSKLSRWIYRPAYAARSRAILWSPANFAAISPQTLDTVRRLTAAEGSTTSDGRRVAEVGNRQPGPSIASRLVRHDPRQRVPSRDPRVDRRKGARVDGRDEVIDEEVVAALVPVVDLVELARQALPVVDGRRAGGERRPAGRGQLFVGMGRPATSWP